MFPMHGPDPPPPPPKGFNSIILDPGAPPEGLWD
jgi:hypothetical protein